MASHSDSAVDSSMLLFDVPPSRMEMVCKIIDGGDGSLGFRDLAARILPSWSELRRTERLEAAGKSPTAELLWSWAQKNKTVGDLLRVLEDMGHQRALDVFRIGGRKHTPNEWSSPNQRATPNEWSSPCAESSQEASDGESALERLCYSFCSSGQGHPLKHTITYRDVREGTRNFHHSAKIGETAFSELYKGTKGQQAFAVKLFKQEYNASWRKQWNAFRTEMEVLHHKQHPNILELWGCFLEGDRYCLVTPFLPNGSLSHWLHEKQGGVSLSWQDRLSIIRGVARAVAYLHAAPPCGVICGNLTSQNILLDEQLQPKLSDFGLAHLRSHPVTQTCTVTVDTGQLGNLGYLPEEYIRDRKPSTALDVYSLGVVMMETLTGLKPGVQNPKHMQLREMLCSEAERSGGGADVFLSHLDTSAGPWPHTVALCLFRLALDCTASRAKTRPSMHRVLEVLSQPLLLPALPPDDAPRTLEFRPAASHSLPEEQDESQIPALCPAPQPGPCECSQSEVIFLSDVRRGAEPQDRAGAEPQDRAGAGRSEQCDLYNSWPVQCSCAAGDGQECEDCVSNGFTAAQPDASSDPSARGSLKQQDHVQNLAKDRFIDKIQLYTKGLIDTEELFSMKTD